MSELKKNKKGYVEITDELDLSLGKSLTDFILEAQKEAIKNDIRANTVMISKKLAKVKGFVHIFGDGSYGEFPPLICGLEAYVTDELPEEFAFGLVKAPSTQREQYFEDGRKQGYKECAKALISEFDSMINLLCAMTGLNIAAFGKYAELRKKYMEDADAEA